MLTYVALQLLSYLVGGPWKDPNGRNLPATRAAQPERRPCPSSCPSTTVHQHQHQGDRADPALRVLAGHGALGVRLSGPREVGSAPLAARHGGFDSNQTVWLAMLIGGAHGRPRRLARIHRPPQGGQSGLPVGLRLHRDHRELSRRLHPIGVLIAGIVLAITYVGGQLATISVKIPNSTAGIFQALMLFFILASDVLVRYRMRRIVRAPKPAPALVPGE